MAKTKISALTTLADGSIAIGDLIPIVDIDDTSQAASGTTKKVTITSLASAVATAFSGDSPTFVNLNTTGTTTLGDSGDATTVNGTLAVTGNLTVDTDTLFVDATNNRVGIGTVNPDSRLDLSGGTLSMGPLNGAGEIRFRTTFANSVSGGSGITALDHSGSSLDGLGIYGHDGVSILTAQTERMRITNSGNVGIGTVAPLYNLQVGNTGATVNGYGAAGAIIGQGAVGSSNSDKKSVFFESGTTPKIASYDYTGSAYLPLQFDAGVANAMYIAVGGYVGIGQTSPSHILHINGAGRSTQSAWDTTSDERTKTNIELADLQKCYDVVKSLALKRFTYKDEIFTDEQIKDRTQLGWIAQEVKQVFPKAVNESDLTYNQKYEDVIIPAIDEVKDEDGNITIQAQAERTEKKLISKDKIENCLNLNVGQIYSSMYGAIQLLIQKVEALEAK